MRRRLLSDDAEPLLPKQPRGKSRGNESANTAASATASPFCSCCASPSPEITSYAAISRAAEFAASALIAELQLPFHPASDPRTADVLKRLWRSTFDDDSSRSSGDVDMLHGPTVPPVPSERWKQLGFQGTDPTTDLRGVAFAGLLFMQRLVLESADARGLARSGATGMPFAICSVNVLWMLRAHLRLTGDQPSFCPCCGTAVREDVAAEKQRAADKQRSRSRSRGASMSGAELTTIISPAAFTAWTLLLVHDTDALFACYAGCVLLLGRLWAARFGSSPADEVAKMAEFRGMLSTVRRMLFDVLESQPRDCSQLSDRLAAVRLPDFEAERER